MGAYIARRTLAGLGTVLLVATITFLLVRALPGDVLLVKLGETGRMSDQQMAAARHEMGLDKPLIEDLVEWFWGLARGDLGHSLLFERETVVGRIWKALPTTAELALIAFLVATLIGIPVGVLSAVKQDSAVDYVVRVLTVLGLAVPQFWIAIIVLLYLSVWFRYAPPFGYTSLLDDPLKNLETFIIPGVLIGARLSSSIMRITRSAVLETLREDYVRTARAKGLREPTIVSRHVLRNAAIPVVTLLGTQVSFLLAGSLIIEVIFSLQGVGWLTYDAILTRDYTQIQGNILTIASIIIGMNLLVDLSYGVLDPRIRQA